MIVINKTDIYKNKKMEILIRRMGNPSSERNNILKYNRVEEVIWCQNIF